MMKEPDQYFRVDEYERKSLTDIIAIGMLRMKQYKLTWDFYKRTKRGWLQLIRKRGLFN